MLKKTQFQLIIYLYIIYTLKSAKIFSCLEVSLLGLELITKLSSKLPEKKWKNYLKHWPRTGGSIKKKRDLWFGMKKNWIETL